MPLFKFFNTKFHYVKRGLKAVHSQTMYLTHFRCNMVFIFFRTVFVLKNIQEINLLFSEFIRFFVIFLTPSELYIKIFLVHICKQIHSHINSINNRILRSNKLSNNIICEIALKQV